VGKPNQGEVLVATKCTSLATKEIDHRGSHVYLNEAARYSTTRTLFVYVTIWGAQNYCDNNTFRKKCRRKTYKL